MAPFMILVQLPIRSSSSPNDVILMSPFPDTFWLLFMEYFLVAQLGICALSVLGNLLTRFCEEYTTTFKFTSSQTGQSVGAVDAQLRSFDSDVGLLHTGPVFEPQPAAFRCC